MTIEDKTRSLMARLREASTSEELTDPELLLDAAGHMGSLLVQLNELETHISSLRVEVMRLHRSEGVY